MDKIPNTLFSNMLEDLHLSWYVDAILIVIAGWGIIVFYTLLYKGKGRKRYLNIIRYTYAETYRVRLQCFLDYTAKYWFKDYQSLDVKPRNNVFGTSVFTESSFEFLLSLAIFYPSFSLYMGWLFIENAGSFGELEILSANVPISIRAFKIFFLLGILYFCKKYFFIPKGYKYVVIFFCVTSFAHVAGAGLSVATIFATIFAAIVGILLYENHKDTPKKIIFWIGLYIFCILLFAGAFSILSRYVPIAKTNSFSLLFFLGVLPLLNAPLDWLSLGISRSLLYSITTRIHSTWKIVGLGFADFIIALFFLFLITLLTTLTIAGLNTLLLASSGRVLINLPKVFADLRSNPWDSTYYWLYFMFLSTLIPTAIHALIAVMSIVFFIPKKTLQNWASDWVEEHHKEDFPTFLKVWAYLSFMPPLAYLIVPTSFIFLLWLILIDWGGGVHVGISLLDCMETVASWIDPAFKA